MPDSSELSGTCRSARRECLKAIIAEMERDNHPDAAAMARMLLPTMEETLRLFRRTLELMAKGKGWIG